MGVCLIIRTSGGTDTSGATATAARVLSGYTCYVNDVKITGTMTNQGTKTASLNAGGSYTIPAGYHSGSGKVTANALSGQTSGTATAARILSGRTAWVNGSKLTGTMTDRGAISQKLAANGSYTVPAGWHNGSGKVTQSLTTQGAKNVTPTTTNQTACAASRWTTGSIVILGSSALVAGNIKKGVKIFNVTGTWVGPTDATVGFSTYYSTNVCNTSKVERRDGFVNKDILNFNGTTAQHLTLMKNMLSSGYTKLWIEANLNYKTSSSNPPNQVKARFDYINLDGSTPSSDRYVEKGSRLTIEGGVYNTWVIFNWSIIDNNYSPPRYVVNPRICVWFARQTGSSNSDWFQMLKWACWFSKS